MSSTSGNTPKHETFESFHRDGQGCNRKLKQVKGAKCGFRNHNYVLRVAFHAGQKHYPLRPQADQARTPLNAVEPLMDPHPTHGPFELSIDDWCDLSTESVAPPASRSPDLLPFGERSPRDFEKSCLLIAEQVGGLREVRLYGVPGQVQRGIDLVGTAADGLTHVWQMKRYAKFDENDLEDAVTDFATGVLPFAGARFVVCVASLAERVQVLDKLERLRHAHDFEIDLYDQRRLSEMLRKRPDIVARLFSQGWADVFALGQPAEAPLRTAADVLGAAVLQGPFAAAGVRPILIEAEIASDPTAAAALFSDAATKVEALGLSQVAVGLRHRQAELLMEAGAPDEPAHLLFGLAWRPFAAGLPDRGHESLGRLRAVSKADGAPPHTSLILEGIGHVEKWFGRPTWNLDPLRALVDRLREHDREVARHLGLWLGETLLADPDAADRAGVEELLCALESDWDVHEFDEVELRLRMSRADLSGEWSGLVGAARVGDLTRRHAVWVLARYARRLAHVGEGRAASSVYREAMNSAFAAEEPAFAEPLLRSWWRTEVTFADALTQQTLDAANLAEALEADPRRGLLVRQYDSYEIGMRKRVEDSPPDALRWLKSALRDASATGALEDERVAYSAIGDLLCDVGEAHVGVRFLVHAGAAKRVLASMEKFLDRTPDSGQLAGASTESEDPELVELLRDKTMKEPCCKRRTE